MNTVILCGGLGTRLSEETTVRPKPMVTIGAHPMLWHIMSIYAHHGHKDFTLALGYKAEVIKEYFLNFFALNSDFEIDLTSGRINYLQPSRRDWRVRLIDTGDGTMTGGRVLRLKHLLHNETFMATYGDGVADIDINRLLAFHRSHGRLLTVTAVHPAGRFGSIQLDDAQVLAFNEKPQSGEGWINGGFFVMEPGVFDYLENDESVLEREPLQRLVRDGQMMAYRHDGFWQCMDTLRERQMLEEMWAGGKAPWKRWAER